MRLPLLFACLLLAGCAAPHEHAASADDTEPRESPPDLRTRKTGDDWPCFLGPTGDGVSKEKGILTRWPKAGPDLVWTKLVGIGYAGPVVSRGRLFFFDRVRNKQRLRALKAETGEELWSFEYPTAYRDQYGYNGGPRCCPVVDGDRVYAFGPEGMLYCVRVKDGKEVWKIDTKREFGVVPNFFGVGSTPVVEKDLLIAQIGGSPRGSDNVAFDELKGNGTGVVAFDKYSGKVKWKASDELASYASPTVRTIGKRRFCFVFARGGLVALDPATGKADFHYPWRASLLESANASNPVVVDNRVLLTECYEIGSALLEVKPGGYKEVWTDKNKGLRAKSLMCHWMTPIHVDGYVYGSSGRHEGNAELRCVELETGKVMWKEKNLTRSSLLLVDGHFVCLSEDGWLRLLKVNPKKYEEVASVQLRKTNKNGEPDENSRPLLSDRECWAAPVLSHGLLYLRGQDRLVCVKLIPEKKK
jgi:outer membrane protein assembly factor BamB